MQANTAVVANQPINFPNFSVENKPYKADSFAIRDGRYVGHDGFIVPKDFDEFHKRFPQYVRNWVNRHADRTASKEDVEDWTQDLLFHLQHLSANSKHREAGKQDIVQTFDPQKHYGANQARFQNYINLCLMNKFRTHRSKRMKDALSQPGNTSLDPLRESGDPFSVSDEFCHSHSDHLQRTANVSEKQGQDRAFIGEFADFVRRVDPCALPAIGALLATGTREGAADSLGITESRFTGIVTRLRQVGGRFLNGAPVPKRRRPYKKRVKRNRTTPLSERSVPPVTRPLLDPRIDPCKGGDDFDQTFARAALSEFTL